MVISPHLTLNRDPAPSTHLHPLTQQAPVITPPQRHDVHARFDRQMKRPLLEGPQLRPVRITPRTLGEDENALPLLPHLRRSLIECRVRGSRVGPVDKDGARERHEPAEKGHEAQ